MSFEDVASLTPEGVTVIDAFLDDVRAVEEAQNNSGRMELQE